MFEIYQKINQQNAFSNVGTIGEIMNMFHHNIEEKRLGLKEVKQIFVNGSQ